MDWSTLLLVFASLTGVGALIGFLIDVLKYFGVVKDGTSATWNAGLNLVALVALFVTGIFAPKFDVQMFDKQLVLFVQFAVSVFGYVTQLLGAKLAHYAAKGAKLIGTTYSG